jgi:hypothetical protein
MSIVRTVLVTLIAISVAVVPASAQAAVSTKFVEMTMPADTDMSCCPSCNDQDNSKGAVVCALKCINFAGAVLPAMIVTQRYLVDAALSAFVNDALREHASSPPTHPPPV